MKLHEYLLLQVAMTTTWSLVTMEETEISSGTNPSSESRKILMPGISTQEDDEYWCTSMKAPDEESYITSFEAVPDKNWAHHMMVFSCDEPGNTDASWPCAGGGCKGKSNIMFAWAYHAEPTILPKDVGFLVGGTKVKYIALQVHYKLKVPEKDHSGIRMTITTTRPKNVAGILIMAASSLHVIPPHQEKYHIDISCQFKGHTEIYPFAFRVHAHSMADVITGYQYNTSWHLLKKGNPRWPQAFYPASESFVIKPHDILVARCTYNSMDKSNAVAIGPAHTDEMCNFYMMYYTDPDLGSSFYQCYGDQYEDLVKNIPEGSDIPPPSNPLLEDIAQGHHKGNQLKNSYHGNVRDSDRGYSFYGSGFGKRDPYFRGYGDGRIPGGGSRTGANGSRSPGGVRRPSSRPPSAGPSMYGYRKGYKTNDGNYPDVYDYVYKNEDDYPDDQNRFYYDVTNQRTRNRGHENTDEIPDTEEEMEQPGQRFSSNRQSISRKPGPGLGQSGALQRSHGHGQTNQDAGSSQPNSSVQVHQSVSPGQKSDVSKTVPETSPTEPSHMMHSNRVHEVVGWPSGAPELGQVSGVSTDLAGNVHVFHRGSRTWEKDSFDLTDVFKQQKDGPIRENTILTFDSSGKLIDQWGADMFYLPHGLHIDKKDNVWITDVAMHQVMCFPVGKHEADLVIGEEFVPGKGSDHFCKPTSVATLRNGQFYVSDGYCNHRIVKFSADGKMLKEWGDDSSSSAADGFPPPSTFTLPHSISLLEDDGILCVADRSNNRIQCFDLNGNFLRQMHSPEINGQVFAVALSSVDGALYVVNGRDNYHPETEIEGFTFSPVTGRLALTWGPNSGTLKQPHDLAVSPDGKSIYVVEIGPNKIWKFAIVDEKGLHQSMKKNGRPSTVDNNSDDNSEKMLEQGDSDHFGTSLIIGGLLIVPVIIVMLVTFFLRLKKGAKGKEPGYAKLHQTDLDDEDEQGFV